MELGSPVTNNYYIRSTKGEIYGLDHNYLRFRQDIAAKLRPQVGVPGLYLTGQVRYPYCFIVFIMLYKT